MYIFLFPGKNKRETMDRPGRKAARREPRPAAFMKGDQTVIIDRIALALAIIGGINWGSVGLFRFDIIAWLFGGQTATVSRVVYTLVGLAALWCISLLFRSDAVTDDGV